MSQSGALRILLICPNAKLREGVVDAFEGMEEHAVLRETMKSYPSGAELARVLRTASPQLVFLSFEQPGTAVAMMRYLEAEASSLPVVALSAEADQAVMREAMRAGAREFLAPPFTGELIGDTLGTVLALLGGCPLAYAAAEHIYSFLPAKPGVGTSTVAMNLSAALAQEPGMRVLLADLDLTCGMMRFLMKLPQDLSIVDAVGRADEMDVSLWPQLVTRREGFDILHSGSINPQAHLAPAQVEGLIDFARIAYNALCFDMSGNMERHSIQVMEDSKRVFLVCNPELGSLFLAREKVEFLNSLGLGDRISAILNRADQELAVPAEKAQEFLGVPIIACLSNDMFEVERAVGGAGSVVSDPKGKHSKLAQQYRALAKTLVRTARSGAGESGPLAAVA